MSNKKLLVGSFVGAAVVGGSFVYRRMRESARIKQIMADVTGPDEMTIRFSNEEEE